MFFATHLTYAQNCSCADNFVWLKETFEKNDAGFQYVIDKKGIEEYTNHLNYYEEKVKTIDSKQECLENLQNWLYFFRKGHLWIDFASDTVTQENAILDTLKIRNQYKNWETFPYNENEYNKYLSKIKEPGLEGVWFSEPYKIGVKKNKNEYIGFIIEADGVYWSKAQVKFKIKEENGKYDAVYYMQDHSVQNIKNIELIGNNYLKMDFVLLKRVSPCFPSNKLVEMYFNIFTKNEAYFEKITENTTLLRIPSFDYANKKIIDSLIENNMNIISSKENLIIDLRFNGGGSDNCFEKIIPIIYTNPIRTIGVEFLSSKTNNLRMIEFMNDPEFSEEDKKWAKTAFEKLNQHIGEFVSLDTTIIDIIAYDTIYLYPKNVGIIINNGCGSTTEQFLLAAKQSKKVKLFGTTTYGSLDISNMHFVKSPCNDFELGYGLSRSKRIPNMTIDGKGIQPDYYIDETINTYDWVDFVNKILSNEF